MPWRRILLVVAVALPTAVACQPANQRGRPAKQSVQVSVVDEDGAPVTSAVMRAIGKRGTPRAQVSVEQSGCAAPTG